MSRIKWSQILMLRIEPIARLKSSRQKPTIQYLKNLMVLSHGRLRFILTADLAEMSVGMVFLELSNTGCFVYHLPNSSVLR